jgi:hypothetical protein
MPATLELVRGEALLGTIAVKPGEKDYPWYSGTFAPTEAFEPLRALFAEELELLQANTADDDAQWDAWEDVHAELHGPGMALRSPDGKFEAKEILVHLDGAEAWWRIN